MNSSKKVVKFLLIFKPGNWIRKAVNVVPKKLVIFEKNTNKFISIADIKNYVNLKEPIISAIVLYANIF